MQLTCFSDLALRVLMYVHAAGGRLVTIEEIASAYRVSKPHLMKVVSALSCAGYITTVRGRAGGIKLARNADKIRLGDVVRHTEPNFDLVECMATGSECVIDGCCRLPNILKRALKAFLDELDRHTVASIALRPKDLRQVLPGALVNSETRVR
ncbi:MAG TPA: Rrf2 family transcriptional regulator [Hyphomicrobiaceae bacterium]|nr:Rrf2 family transcriptional regulator [Hyphomicrobiaceae bacterium]